MLVLTAPPLVLVAIALGVALVVLRRRPAGRTDVRRIVLVALIVDLVLLVLDIAWTVLVLAIWPSNF